MKSSKKHEMQSFKGNAISTFVLKTFNLLSNPENASIVTWGPQGFGLVIKNLQLFKDQVLPKYFRHNKYESFVRQLNMYNFYKVKEDNSLFFINDYFHKNNFQMLKFIRRKTEKKMKSHDPKNLTDMSNIKSQSAIEKLLEYENCENEKIRKVHFKQSEKQIVYSQNFSTLMESSKRFIHNSQSKYWGNIKQSQEISMKLLENNQNLLNKSQQMDHDALDSQKENLNNQIFLSSIKVLQIDYL